MQAEADDQRGRAEAAEEGGGVVGDRVRNVIEAGRERHVAAVVAEQAHRAELTFAQRRDKTRHFPCDPRLIAQRHAHQARVPDRDQHLAAIARGRRNGLGAQGERRAGAELGGGEAESLQVCERCLVADDGGQRPRVERSDRRLGHRIGAMAELPELVVDAAVGEPAEQQRRPQFAQRIDVDVESAVLVEVAAADHDAVPVEVDLVNRPRRQPGEPAVVLAAGRRHRQQVGVRAERGAKQVSQRVGDRLVADVVTPRANPEDVGRGHPSRGSAGQTSTVLEIV